MQNPETIPREYSRTFTAKQPQKVIPPIAPINLEIIVKRFTLPLGNETLNPYIALLLYNKAEREFNRIFINRPNRIWNKPNKQFSMIFDFQALPGMILECRLSSKNHGKSRVYYEVTPKKRHKLKKISALRAHYQAMRYQAFMPDRARNIPSLVKVKVWRRDGGKCRLCGSNRNIEFDHIIPFSLGGASSVQNVQLLCQHCNGSKSDRIQ